MKIRKFSINLALLFIPLIMISSCQYGVGVEGNGQITSETRTVKSFDQMEVSGGFSVILTQGPTEGVVVEADENLMDLISTEVMGGVLEIKSRENIRGSRDIKIFVSMVNLSRIKLSGAVDLSSENQLNLEHLSVRGSGASTLTLNLNVNSLDAELSGANNVTLAGQATSFTAKLTGASDLKAFEFDVNNLEIKVTGAGDARVSAIESLKVNISGAGSVTYQGDPSIEQTISGAGSLSKKQ
ncbi:MAG: DUF2807 domain-containing protein [Bacteroidales bacterium]|nr:DUF2807 domain-containing protein [Bacteroidales bacterium]